MELDATAFFDSATAIPVDSIGEDGEEDRAGGALLLLDAPAAAAASSSIASAS